MKKIVVLLCLFSLFSCKSQAKLENASVENFNIEKYKDWEINPEWSPSKTSKFLKKGNDCVKIYIDDDDIVVETSSAVNNYNLYQGYFPNKRLQLIGREFYGFSIGIWKNYDANGKLIKEIDRDAPYKFSVEQLIKKMQKEYGLDINKQTKTIVARRWQSSELKDKPFYCVFYYLKDASQDWKYILIDGSTGETLFTTFFILNDYESLSPFFQYLELLEKKEAEDNAYYKSYKGKD